MTGLHAALALVVLMLAGQPALGQVYTFENMLAPASGSLEGHYMFYILEGKGDPATVEFQDLVAHVASHSVKDAEFASYKGVQVSLIPYTDLFQYIDKDHFCADSADASSNKNAVAGQLLLRSTLPPTSVFAATVPFGEPMTPQKFTLPKHQKGGAYLLSISNCGWLSNASVTGKVVVRSTHGLLPGSEIMKKPFYGWLTVAYAVAAIVWVVFCLRWWTHLLGIHWSMATVVIVGLIEVSLRYLYLQDWNVTGERGSYLFVATISAATMKSVASYMLVLVTALGWGVTRLDLDHMTVLKVQLVGFLYMTADFLRECVLSYRHSHIIAMSAKLGVLMPVVILDGCVFMWIFNALGKRKAELANQSEKRQLFDELKKAMIFALSVGLFARILQIGDFAEVVNIPFQYQWLLGEGTFHIIYLSVLLFLIKVWMPNENSDRYAYSTQIGMEDVGEADGPVCADEAPDMRDAADREESGNRVAPQTFGARNGQGGDNFLETEGASVGPPLD